MCFVSWSAATAARTIAASESQWLGPAPSFLGTDQINLDLNGFDPAGIAGNLNAVHHFATTTDLRTEVSNARMWGGLHYRFSTVAGLALGQNVATYDLAHAFGKS